MIVTLPWPDKKLSPNARQHWGALATAKKAARAEANWQALADLPAQVRQDIAEGAGRIPIQVTFFPPDNRRRDDDNMVAAFKASRDGLADALLVDDRRFRPHYVFADPEKPGRIEVEFVHSKDGTKGDSASQSGCCCGIEMERPAECVNTQAGLTSNRLSTGGS